MDCDPPAPPPSPPPAPSFYDRAPGTIKFDPVSPGWPYLAQINEKLRLLVTWEVLRVGGEAHTPTFHATPGCEIERLTEYTRAGGSKKAAMKAAAEAMALGGLCVSFMKP